MKHDKGAPITLYKLTDGNGQTGKHYNPLTWETGLRHFLRPCKEPQLCSKDVIHAYRSVEIALFMNPYHCGFKRSSMKLFECISSGGVVVEDFDKVGVFDLEVVMPLDLPEWYTDTEMAKRVALLFMAKTIERAIKLDIDWRGRAAIDQIDVSLTDNDRLSLGLADILKSWSREHYRYNNYEYQKAVNIIMGEIKGIMCRKIDREIWKIFRNDTPRMIEHLAGQYEQIMETFHGINEIIHETIRGLGIDEKFDYDDMSGIDYDAVIPNAI